MWPVTTDNVAIADMSDLAPRVLSVQSHVVSGYVGNKSATFPRQSQRSAEPGGGGEPDPQQLFYPGIPGIMLA